MSEDVLSQVLTVPEVAAMHHVTRDAVQYACREGRLQCRRAGNGGAWLITRRSAEAWRPIHKPRRVKA